MAVSMETQRLISVSLGKIAQSRGQRGGINLHKNLLVATVLHKARNAYMIESYSYQQNIHRQKLMEHYQLQQSISSQKLESTPVVEPNKGESVPHDCHSNQVTGPISSDCHLAQISTSTHDSVSSDTYLNQSSTTTTDPAPCDYQLGQVSATPTEPISRDSHVGQLGATLTGQELIRSDVSSESVPEPISALYAALSAQDKENSPPFGEDQPNDVQENVSFSETRTSSFQDDHIAAAVQLSQDAQMASSCEHNLKQQTLTSGSTTCNVLKRRRDNQSSSLHEFETPVSKIARLLQHDNPTPPSYSNFNACDDSRSSESQISNTSSSSDSNQILNLVNIFNSGFSGLCAAAAASSSDLHVSNYQIEFDISQSHTRKIATKAG